MDLALFGPAIDIAAHPSVIEVTETRRPGQAISSRNSSRDMDSAAFAGQGTRRVWSGVLAHQPYLGDVGLAHVAPEARSSRRNISGTKRSSSPQPRIKRISETVADIGDAEYGERNRNARPQH